MADPLITVLMPTYNGAKYLKQTINSVLGQTFKDFELLIINDCSPDNTDDIVAAYTDPRIRYVKNSRNRGISGSSNYGFSLARGKYIARQDHDDISLPERLEKQVAYMENHPEVGILGTGFKVFGSKSKNVLYPEDDAAIKALLLFKMPLAHQTSMMRKELFYKNRLQYDESYASSNDRKLWIDAAPYMQFHNLPEILLRYRMYKGMTSVTKRDRVLEEGRRLRGLLYRRLKLEFSLPELAIIDNYLMPGRARIRNENIIFSIEKILLRFCEANRQTQVFDEDSFRAVCAGYWSKRCLNYSFYARRPAQTIFQNSPLAKDCPQRSYRLLLKTLNALWFWR